jgi:GAF domain-containing protein
MVETIKGKPVVIKDATTDKRVQHRKEKKEEGIVSILSAPIMAKEEVIGALRLYSGVPREFKEDEIMLVTALAHQGGLAIQNASLYLMVQEDMKDLKDDMWSHKSWF